MTTGAVLISDGLWKAGVLGVGDILEDDDAQLALRDLNRMLDSWSNERSMLYTITPESFSTVASTAAYTTLELTSDARPVSIDSIYIVSNSARYNVRQVDNLVWQAIPYPASEGLPTVFYYDAAMPDGNIRFYPTPDAVYTVYVVTRRVLSAPITLTTDVILPAGYEKAIVDNLAVELCGTFKVDPTPLMVEAARESRAVIKRANKVSYVMTPDFVVGPYRSNILDDC